MLTMRHLHRDSESEALVELSNLVLKFVAATVMAAGTSVQAQGITIRWPELVHMLPQVDTCNMWPGDYCTHLQGRCRKH